MAHSVSGGVIMERPEGRNLNRQKEDLEKTSNIFSRPTGYETEYEQTGGGVRTRKTGRRGENEGDKERVGQVYNLDTNDTENEGREGGGEEIGWRREGTREIEERGIRTCNTKPWGKRMKEDIYNIDDNIDACVDMIHNNANIAGILHLEREREGDHDPGTQDTERDDGEGGGRGGVGGYREERERRGGREKERRGT